MDIAAWLQSLDLERSGSKPASPSPLAWSSPQLCAQGIRRIAESRAVQPKGDGGSNGAAVRGQQNPHGPLRAARRSTEAYGSGDR